MTKYCVMDGIDNTGKTFLMGMLEQDLVELGLNVKTLHFPSKHVFESDIFHELAVLPKGDENKELKMKFIDIIIEDVYNQLKDIDKSVDVCLIDRMIFSTLIYQGSGVYGNYENEFYAITKYNKMLSSLGINTNYPLHEQDFSNIRHFLFIRKVEDGPKDKNKDKNLFDNSASIYYNNMVGLLYVNMNFDLLMVLRSIGSYVLFDEKEYNRGNRIPTEIEIAKINIGRVSMMKNWIMESN